MSIACKETLSPVAVLIPFKDENHAVLQANQTPRSARRRYKAARRTPRSRRGTRSQGRIGLGKTVSYIIGRSRRLGLEPCRNSIDLSTR
jgi:hypothetical protein